MEDTYVAQTETTLTPPPVEEPKKKFPKWVLLILVIIILLLVIGSGIFLLNQKNLQINPGINSNSQKQNSVNSKNQTDNINAQNSSNWKKITSPNNKLSFKYPSENWEISTSSATTIECPQQSCPSPYNIYNFSANKSNINNIQQFIANLNTTNPDLNPYIKDYKLITINGIDAVEILIAAPPGSNTGPTVQIYIVIDGVGYVYSYTYLDPSLNSATSLDQLPDPNPNILSTLQLGSSSGTNITATWKTYIDRAHNLTLQYPQGWFVTSDKNDNNCVKLSNAQDPSPAHSQTVISLCTYPNQTLSAPTGNSSQVTVNGRTGYRIQQTSNWGPGENIYFANPKGGVTALGILFGNNSYLNLMVSTLKFTN